MDRKCGLLAVCLSLAAVFGLNAGCKIEVTPDLSGISATQPSNNLQQIGGDPRQPSGDGSVRGVDEIRDGSSNTISVGEDPAAPGTSDPRPAEPAPPEPAPPEPAPSEPPAAEPGSGLTPEVLAEITAQLGDKFFTFASSSGNSDNNAFLTGTNELALCAFGRFGRRETTIFSSGGTTFDSTTDSIGTWSVIAVDGQPVLELRVESSGDANAPSRVLLPIAADANGTLFLDGQRATVSDAAADCAAAQATP